MGLFGFFTHDLCSPTSSDLERFMLVFFVKKAWPKNFPFFFDFVRWGMFLKTAGILSGGLFYLSSFCFATTLTTKFHEKPWAIRWRFLSPGVLSSAPAVSRLLLPVFPFPWLAPRIWFLQKSQLTNLAETTSRKEEFSVECMSWTGPRKSMNPSHCKGRVRIALCEEEEKALFFSSSSSLLDLWN